MKKNAQNTSKLNPTNFVRRVLSRSSSNHSKTTLDSNETEKPMGGREKIQVDFEQELSLLKKQVSSLQITVNSMQRDTERKEVALVNLSKEKEQLSIDLKKQRRSNVNLKQQLDDERHFYYKEKEQFCHEMNTYKKMKKSSSKESSVRDFNENNYKNEIAKLKDELSHALEANYNLSVKFLRMKNTKLGLKQQLEKIRELQEFGAQEYGKKVEEIKKELDLVVNEQFTKPIPPSSKKYLQVLKHNGSLIHENLCLQLELDRLHLELDKLKMLEMQNHTNSKLKFIRRSAEGSNKSSKSKLSTVSISVKNESTKSKSRTNDKQTENKHLNNTKNLDNGLNATVTNNSKEADVAVIKNPPNNTNIRFNLLDGTNPFNGADNMDHSHTEVQESGVKDAAKFELMNVSNSNLSSQINESEVSYYTSIKCCQAYRTQSAPEIVQSTEDLK